MILSPGTRLGPYEIVGAIGAGGMGEVFRARDSRLNREVAIKILPAAFLVDADNDRLARFEREARATSALNHPNILTIYDIGSHEGAPYIVAELLEGEELRVALKKGPLPVLRALDYAQQIARGLAAAHDKGIVHRDLKPGNLLITSDGRVKILDFGLAKLQASRPDPVDSEIETRKALTSPGVVMGTVGYMSPEQVRGHEADHRADIFSFGVILHEMLSGKRTFAGGSSIEVMNAILGDDPPDLTESNAKVSPQIARVVRRCLEKNPEARFHSAHDLAFALEALSEPSRPSGRAAAMSGNEAKAPWLISNRAAWPLAAFSTMALVGLWWANLNRPLVAAPSARLTIEFPSQVSFAGSQLDVLAVSPNGRLIVFTGQTLQGKRQLWIRPVDSLDAQPIAGTEDPFEPFWSPDSRSVAFGAQGKLKRVDLSGGRPRVICDAPRLVGGSWNKDGVILFAPDFNRGLSRVSADGGTSRPATRPDPARQETAHGAPTFLPDGRHFIFIGGPTAARQVLLGSLDSSDVKALTRGLRATFAPPGFLLVARDSGVFAHAFDADRLGLSGDPVSLFDLDGPLQAGSANQGVVPSASENGILVLQRNFAPESQLAWFDRRGKRLGVLGPVVRAAVTFAPRVSPDGRSVVMQNREDKDETRGIWTIDIARDLPIRLSTFSGQYPLWSPDGKRVAWLTGQAQGVIGIWIMAANGVGEPELLLAAGAEAGGNTFPADWSSDGRFILYRTRGETTRGDIWMLPMTGDDRRPHAVLATEFDETHAQVSPDGHWIAYRSDLSGTYEIYVQSLTPNTRAGSERFRISTGGGSQPRFRRDGQEIFYLAPQGDLMAVPVRSTDTSFTYGIPAPLFKARTLPLGADPNYEYDVTADGQRFLIGAIQDGPHATPPKPVVFINWAETLTKRAAKP